MHETTLEDFCINDTTDEDNLGSDILEQPLPWDAWDDFIYNMENDQKKHAAAFRKASASLSGGPGASGLEDAGGPGASGASEGLANAGGSDVIAAASRKTGLIPAMPT